jgi:hypothetical protein
MPGSHLRSTIKSVVAILCAACFLTVSLGSVSRAIANDPWETWPKKKTLPGVAPYPETDEGADANGAAKGEDAAGKETAKGKSSGTIWWIAAGTAVVIGIAIAIAGGGGGGDGGTTTNPGHQ